MTLSPEEKSAVLGYRIDKSRQTFKEACDNAELGNWSLVANRLYYATFYMVLAVNLDNGDFSKSHSGTFALFSKRYISNGVLSKDEGNLYRSLFSMRQSGDYDDLFDWEEEDILPILPKVKSLLEKIESLINRNH